MRYCFNTLFLKVNNMFEMFGRSRKLFFLHFVVVKTIKILFNYLLFVYRKSGVMFEGLQIELYIIKYPTIPS